MVVGNGLLAKAFSSFQEKDDVIIFASGVSNSNTTDPHEFQREFNLISSFAGTKKKLIYFSTSNRGTNLYFQHKKKIEDLICTSFENFLIFRIPNVVGNGGNPDNFFNLMKRKIKNCEFIEILDVYRSLIDVDDVENICSRLMHEKNQIINFSYIEKVKVKEIVETMIAELDANPKLIYKINQVNEENYENSKIIDKFIKKNIESKNYTNRTIRKYI